MYTVVDKSLPQSESYINIDIVHLLSAYIAPVHILATVYET